MTSQLRQDLGPEFDDLRGPISELQKLRGMTPRAALTKHLLDGDDSFLTGNFDRPAANVPATPAPNGQTNGAQDGAQQHAPGKPPFDSDAT
jgi:sec-independent protein translocase protein TatB